MTLREAVDGLTEEEMRRADAAQREIEERLRQRYGEVVRPCNWVVVAMERLAEVIRWRVDM